MLALFLVWSHTDTINLGLPPFDVFSVLLSHGTNRSSEDPARSSCLTVFERFFVLFSTPYPQLSRVQGRMIASPFEVLPSQCCVRVVTSAGLQLPVARVEWANEGMIDSSRKKFRYMSRAF